jgi:hypothetical protein
MNDDAIAPVVAVMMILVIVVTLFSIWNAIYLPGFKQQAEVEHLGEVEEGILRFSADIDNSIALWRNGTQTESIPLGGGDILLNTIRSGGELRIQQLEGAAITISVDGTEYYGYLSKITYRPVSNFWIDQGYSWENGAVNVSKRSVSVPISLPNQYQEAQRAFLEHLFQTGYSNENRNVSIKLVNITAHDLHAAASGNGISQLKLNTTITTHRQNGVTGISIIGDHGFQAPSLNPEYPVNVTIERLDIILSAD